MYKKFNGFIIPCHYVEPYGIHGMGHVRRVLFWADAIAENYNLTDKDKIILGLACCYHDIGRIHNGEDDLHGKLSCDKIVELNLLDGWDLKEHEKELVLRLIAAHCLSDNLFIGTIRDKLLFNILKDADGLDRVRIFDLDPNYLRLDASHELVDVAWKLFIKDMREENRCDAKEDA